MTEREKIIEVIAPYVSAWGDDEAIADALVEAGIGDVSECKKESAFYRCEIAFLDEKILELEKTVRKLQKELQGEKK